MGTSGTPLYVIVDRLGAFFYWTRFIWQCTIRLIWSICSEN